jgi:hypothetical protein
VAEKEDRKEACRTYIEQTKLLVTLASAFVVAPAVLIGYLRNEHSTYLVSAGELREILAAELLFVLSVLFGYIVLGAVTGTQAAGEFNVYRRAVKLWSLFQLGSYLVGLLVFAWILYSWASGQANVNRSTLPGSKQSQGLPLGKESYPK